MLFLRLFYKNYNTKIIIQKILVHELHELTRISIKDF
jgi:hypothetical protein